MVARRQSDDDKQHHGVHHKRWWNWGPRVTAIWETETTNGRGCSFQWRSTSQWRSARRTAPTALPQTRKIHSEFVEVRRRRNKATMGRCAACFLRHNDERFKETSWAYVAWRRSLFRGKRRHHHIQQSQIVVQQSSEMIWTVETVPWRNELWVQVFSRLSKILIFSNAAFQPFPFEYLRVSLNFFSNFLHVLMQNFLHLNQSVSPNLIKVFFWIECTFHLSQSKLSVSEFHQIIFFSNHMHVSSKPIKIECLRISSNCFFSSLNIFHMHVSSKPIKS